MFFLTAAYSNLNIYSTLEAALQVGDWKFWSKKKT